MTDTKIKVLVVDDESLARKTIQFSLQEHTDWEVVGECDRGDKVLSSVENLKPDVLFLDIKMPGLDGLKVCEQVQSLENPPVIVFVTAFDAHAVEAFELCALDYLLKPYDDDRFSKTIERIFQNLQSKDTQKLQIDQLNKITNSDHKILDTLIVRSVGRIQLIDTKTVNWLSTAGNYVELHTDDGAILYRVSLSYLQKHLENDFLRVHRTAMLRVSQVTEFLTISEGQYTAVLKNGDKVSVSQSYKADLLSQLGIE